MRCVLNETVRTIMPATLRPHSILAGPLRGATIYTRHDYPGAILGSTERPLLGWFGPHVLPAESCDWRARRGYEVRVFCPHRISRIGRCNSRHVSNSR